MDFDHVHFVVDDALYWQNWFIKCLNFEPICLETTPQSQQAWLRQGQAQICLSSPSSPDAPLAIYLKQHPPGVIDLAFAVTDLEGALDRLLTRGACCLQPIQTIRLGGQLKRTCQVMGWGGLQHTLVEAQPAQISSQQRCPIEAIDHAVLNVPQGELERAVAWYQQVFDFHPQQMFDIRTPASGLCSQVMVHAQGNALLPINEPSTRNSQIQEFLDHNRGSGIQHIALRSPDLVNAIATLRAAHLPLLTVPDTYYRGLRERTGYSQVSARWDAIAQQQILVDWFPTQPQAMLLQTFTQPIFAEPTFFFELIERRPYWEQGVQKNTQGFGEGNFQALFEAIEREQRQRGSLGLSAPEKKPSSDFP